jgi:hypothetical protein
VLAVKTKLFIADGLILRFLLHWLHLLRHVRDEVVSAEPNSLALYLLPGNYSPRATRRQEKRIPTLRSDTCLELQKSTPDASNLRRDLRHSFGDE